MTSPSVKSSGSWWWRSVSLVRFGASRALTVLALVVLRIYRVVLRPMLGPACRFAPSCSHYAEDAVRSYGPAKGIRLAVARIVRCHPWSLGGWDPVPERRD